MHLIQEIGSYAGLAAIPGLAILSALYFSQARDVRRLREWAGRAPERTVAPARVAPRPATQAAQPSARPASAAGGASAAAATATVARPAPAEIGPTHPPVPRVPPAGQTSIIGPGAITAGTSDPWYRRVAGRLPAARYLAILLVGILVIGGGIAFAITQLGGSSGSSARQPAPPAAKPAAPASTAIRPADVSVSVLNATGVTGLAHTVGSKLEQQGFKLENQLTASQGQVAESVVEFKPGATRAAALVRRKLGITQIEPADRASLMQGGNADVVVVLGADKVHGQGP